jgi:hypothetical protein
VRRHDGGIIGRRGDRREPRVPSPGSPCCAARAARRAPPPSWPEQTALGS